MKKLSIIIVYNNESKLSETIEYIKKQTIFDDIELITLDNTSNKYKSASQALNFGASQSTADILLFMHQDVLLWENSAIEINYNKLVNTEKTIAGVAGVAKVDNKVHYDIYETKNKLVRASKTNGIMDAYTLDECMFGMSKKLWEKIKFDESTCNKWHLYCADICYQNMLCGGDNIILSMGICHNSFGNVDDITFLSTLKKMVKKYTGRLERINTPCVDIECTMNAYYKYSFKKKVKILLKKLHIYK